MYNRDNLRKKVFSMSFKEIAAGNYHLQTTSPVLQTENKKHWKNLGKRFLPMNSSHRLMKKDFPSRKATKHQTKYACHVSLNWLARMKRRKILCFQKIRNTTWIQTISIKSSTTNAALIQKTGCRIF